LCDWHGWPDLAQEIGIERCSLEVMLNRFLPTSLTIRYVVQKVVASLWLVDLELLAVVTSDQRQRVILA
jgi:hypothetical protein